MRTTEEVNQSAAFVTDRYDSYRGCLKLAGLRCLWAPISVIHPDWLIGSNLQLRVSNKLHTDSNQNSLISRKKSSDSIFSPDEFCPPPPLYKFNVYLKTSRSENRGQNNYATTPPLLLLSKKEERSNPTSNV